MTADRRVAYLAGDRPDDVALYLAADTVSDVDTLREQSYAYDADGGVLLVVDGQRGQSVFEKLTGKDAMDFSGAAMKREGDIDETLTSGTCPDIEGDGAHDIVFVFSFAEAQNAEVGGLYAEGDVIHAYAQCSCGTAYADKWVADR